MNYVTGETIKLLREKKKLTQKELASLICVSDKTISKWETRRGLPDISILADLSAALNVSVPELLTGDWAVNNNRSSNMKKTVFYVCPVCGNIVQSVETGAFSCCGIRLPELEAEEAEASHGIHAELSDGAYYVTMEHEMEKSHFISFICYVTSDRAELVTLYPEQNAAVRFQKRGHGYLYAYCNRHGLFRITI